MRSDGGGFSVRKGSDGCWVEFGGEFVMVPPEVQPHLEFLGKTPTFQVSEMTAEGDLESALCSVRWLVRQGLARVSE